MTFQVGWGQRALGLAVLLGVAALIVATGFDLPWPSWIVLGLFGFAALVSTISNFGERVHADAEGLRWENVLLARLGIRPSRRATWDEITSAVELDGKTFFLTVEGQDRWVLDALEGQDELRTLLQDHGIVIEQRTRPRLRDLGRGSRQPPS